MTSIDTLRNASLTDLASTLRSQLDRRLDVVVPAKVLRSVNGDITVPGTVGLVGPDGVTSVDGMFRPTVVGIEGLSSKLNIPSAYLKRLAHTDDEGGHVALFDDNINGWLERSTDKWLLRLMKHDRDDAPNDGVLRAVLSDSYRTIDNWDVLLATLDGVQAAGITGAEVKADLTTRRMYVRIMSKQITANAQALVSDYRSPFDNRRRGDQLPLVWAGLVITNSEVGNGAFNIVPEITFEVCTNGMTITKDAMRKVHLGARLDEGVVNWSAKTVRQNLALVKSQTADAVAQFLSAEYVQSKVDAMTREAGIEIDEPAVVIAKVSQQMGYTKAQGDTILDMFIKGGSVTAGGVMQAVTATAQAIEDGDDAYALESSAMDAMSLAAAIGGTGR